MAYSAIASVGFDVLRDFFAKPTIGLMVDSISHGGQCHTGNDLKTTKEYLECNLENYTKDIFFTLSLCFLIIIIFGCILLAIAYGKMKKIYYNLTYMSRQQANQYNHQSVSLGTNTALEDGIASMLPPAPRAYRREYRLPPQVLRDDRRREDDWI